MKVGLQISSFTWPGGAEAIAPTLARVVRDADTAGFDSIWVMDHFFQIRSVGRPEEPMLEGWTTLGFMAAHTQRARRKQHAHGVTRAHQQIGEREVLGDESRGRSVAPDREVGSDRGSANARQRARAT